MRRSDDELANTPMERLVKAHREAVLELREIRQRKRAVIEEEQRQEFYIAKLEKLLGEHEKALVKTKQPGDPLSIRVLIEKVLEKHPEGVLPPLILAEMKEDKYETTARNPLANVVSTLHRHKGGIFGQTEDGRWFLTRLGTPAPKLRAVQSNPHGEMTMKNGAPVPKGMR